MLFVKGDGPITISSIPNWISYPKVKDELGLSPLISLNIILYIYIYINFKRIFFCWLILTLLYKIFKTHIFHFIYLIWNLKLQIVINYIILTKLIIIAFFWDKITQHQINPYVLIFSQQIIIKFNIFLIINS